MHAEIVPLVPEPTLITKIPFDCGITVTIRHGFVRAPSPTLTAIVDLVAARLPGYGSFPFILDEDFNIAQVSSVW